MRTQKLTFLPKAHAQAYAISARSGGARSRQAIYLLIVMRNYCIETKACPKPGS